MTIASALQDLANDITNARSAVVAKGGTITPSGGSSQLATDIATIPSGGEPVLKDISPITQNGTYAVFDDLIVVDSFVCTGQGSFRTDISLTAGTQYNYEVSVNLPQLQNDGTSIIFGAGYSSGIDKLQYYKSGSYTSLNVYTSNRACIINNPTTGDALLTTDFSNSKVYLNGTQYTTSSTSATSGGYALDILGLNYLGSHENYFIGTFKYLKIFDLDFNLLYHFVPARNSNNEPILLEKINGKTYTLTGTGVSVGNDVEDLSYDGFKSPLIVSIPPTKKWGVSIDNYWLNQAKGTPDLEDFVCERTTLPSSLSYALRYAGLKSVLLKGAYIYTQQYGYSYAFANNAYLETIVFDFTDRTASSSFDTYLFYHVLEYTSYISEPYDNPTATFTLYVPNISGSYAFSYAFLNATGIKYFSFPITTNLTTTGNNIFYYAFSNCYQAYKQNAGINIFRFPVLNQIGANSTSYHTTFNFAFWSSVSSTYHYGELIFPELVIISCRNSSASNGHFNQGNSLNKVYLPKFNRDNAGTTGTTYSRYLFNNCPNITELHFGIENQSAVEAMSGYSYKFGATNASLIFDMPNHLTVDGTVYDRSGAEYDYDTSHYSWKNGSTVIYTTNAINPAVGDTVYTKSGNTYTASGTITAIA